MAKCPTCGKEVETPNKEWKIDKIHVKQYRALRKKIPEIHKDGLATQEVTLHGSS